MHSISMNVLNAQARMMCDVHIKRLARRMLAAADTACPQLIIISSLPLVIVTFLN